MRRRLSLSGILGDSYIHPISTKRKKDTHLDTQTHRPGGRDGNKWAMQSLINDGYQSVFPVRHRHRHRHPHPASRSFCVPYPRPRAFRARSFVPCSTCRFGVRSWSSVRHRAFRCDVLPFFLSLSVSLPRLGPPTCVPSPCLSPAIGGHPGFRFRL